MAVDCSLRERGWCRAEPPEDVPDSLLLASAGMVPNSSWVGLSATAEKISSAADIGSEEITVPRVSRDGPQLVRDANGLFVCSPRVRGWALGQGVAGLSGALLPAPVGMVSTACFPRERVWSHAVADEDQGHVLLPA
ncbi:hypothetical protein GCM10010226_88120 [Streptomyces phaeofaciens]|uniref:Uncharacterized protein n=1 Tax=Streptomyces phaeofaciens TaxID=68254 RepID=A0A918M106_9ACTN|nr:hypothetical protein GCM10010226_88120 [Streptomyces phaeofaciens]